LPNTGGGGLAGLSSGSLPGEVVALLAAGLALILFGSSLLIRAYVYPRDPRH
jgi:hypothetical protein